MKAALPCLALLLAVLGAPAASAGSVDCGLIRDHDKRRAASPRPSAGPASAILSGTATSAGSVESEQNGAKAIRLPVTYTKAR